MTEPEEALPRARAAAARLRAEGVYPGAPTEATPSAGVSLGKLAEWAMIEPDLREVRSTRRLGAPVTAFKRVLLRLLEQYHVELRSQQTRFNLTLLGEVHRLEQRIDELERRLDDVGGR
ncbi:MAG: hypothetical protein M3Z27_04075 [Actinomycetota bacterium]|nr:hypothetical protein [Actinomycetota bacterium]